MACTALHMTTAAIATLAFVFGTASQNKMHELGRMERELMRMETQLESLKMRMETKQTKLEMLQMGAGLTASLLQMEARLTATMAQAWGVPVPASAAAPAVPPVIATVDPLEKLTMKILTMEVQVAELKLEIAIFDDKKNNSGNLEKCRREVDIAELEWEKKQWEYELMKETNEERKKALRETIDEIQNEIISKEEEKMQW